MKKVELILIVLAVIAIPVNLSGWPGTNMFAIVAMALLSMLYFYLGFAVLNNVPASGIFKKHSYAAISKWRIFGAVAAGIVFSLFPIGFLFKLLFWPGASSMLLGAVTLLIPVLIIAIVKMVKSKNLFYRDILVRASVYGVLALFAIQMYDSKIAAIKYSEFPEYVAAMEVWEQDPGNAVLEQKLQIERQRMYDIRDGYTEEQE